MINLQKGNTTRFVSTILCAGLAVIINYMISMALTPYITKTMGTDAYGFISLAKTFSQYATVFTAGLNSYAARFIALAHHKKDTDAEKKYYSSVFYANVFLSVIILIIAAFLVVFLERIIKIPTHLINDVKILFLLNFVNFLVLATGTCFSVYGHINNKLALTNIIKIIAYISEAIVLVLMFAILPAKLYYVGIALLLSSICIFILNAYVSHKDMPELEIKHKYFSFKAVKELVLSGIWNSINSLGNILNTGLDLLITNLMLTAVAMGRLSIVKTLSTIFVTLFQTVTSPWQPILLKKYSSGNIHGTVSNFKQGIKITAFFSSLLFAGLIAYGLPYFKLWTPGENTSMLYNLTVVTLLGMLIEGTTFPLLYTYTLTLKNKLPCFVTIGSGLLNVIGMYFMLKFTNVGIYSVVITTSILAWMVYFIFTPIYTAHCLKIKWFTFYPTILRVLIASLICLSICFGMSLIYMPTSWIGLIFSAGVCVIVCAPIYILTVASKVELKNLTNKIIRRKNRV